MTFRPQAWPLRALSSSISAPKGRPMLAQSRRELDVNDVVRPSAGRSRRVHGVGWVGQLGRPTGCGGLQTVGISSADWAVVHCGQAHRPDRTGGANRTHRPGPYQFTSPNGSSRLPTRLLRARAASSGQLPGRRPISPGRSSPLPAPRRRERRRAPRAGQLLKRPARLAGLLTALYRCTYRFQTPIHAKLA